MIPIDFEVKGQDHSDLEQCGTSGRSCLHLVWMIIIPRTTNVFVGILESAFLSVRPCVHPSVYKILVYVKALAGVLSHI